MGQPIILNVLATQFTANTEDVIPISGQCKECMREMSWDDIIKTVKAPTDLSEAEDEEEGDNSTGDDMD